MKKLIIIVLVLAMLACLCSCNTRQDVEVEYNDENTYVIDVQYDTYNNLISKTVYNKITGQTYLYTWTYKYHNGFWECVDSDIVVVSRGGTIIYPDNENQ